MSINSDPNLARIAAALEKLAFGSLQHPGEGPSPSPTNAYVWRAERGALEPVATLPALPLDLLLGIDRVKATLLENTRRFAGGLPANNALLWGARGMGKSSLVKSLHQHLITQHDIDLVEISRNDLASLGMLNDVLAARPNPCLVYCDDLSFDYDDGAYKSLKTVLDGGLKGRPANVLFYATSNRRHLMPRDMMENEAGSAIHPGEAVEEKLSLSDRFGLWLGFHKCDQETYLGMIAAYCQHFGLKVAAGDWRSDALEWQVTRGSRSGRIAWQFFIDLAAREGEATPPQLS